jgi:hypothetical protein
MEAERGILKSFPTAQDVVEFIMKATEQKKVLMVICLWFIWTERNVIREEGRRRSAEMLARSVEMYAKENADLFSKPQVQRVRYWAHWTKPPEDVLKLNVDASFFHESKAGSWGFLIRDSDGDVMLIGRGRVNYLVSAFHAELIASLQGLQRATALGIGHIIVETDAKEVVAAIKTQFYDGTAVGYLIDEIRTLLRLNFLAYEVVFVGRDCNRAAHELVVMGHFCNEDEELVSSSVPNNISVIVANDLLANE